MTREYYLKHREESLARSRKYRELNRESIALQKKKAHEENPEYDRKRSRCHYEANKVLYIARAKEYYETHKEKHINQSKEWALKNREKRLEVCRKFNHKFRSTPKGNLSSTISKRMNESLRKGMKSGRHWEDLVSFTIDQLKTHLEKLFTPEMTWDNYGTVWHIDHKIPIALFNFERPDDIDFRICWSLKNLQPFQPAFAIGVK